MRERGRPAELRSHFFTSDKNPDWVPYRTSYYKEDWGFCLSEHQLASLANEAEIEVCIDSTLEDGHLTYGEYLLQGEQSDEVLVSCHVCHPSLANDNLSGIAVAVELARYLAQAPRRYSYRFVFVPGTIGAITWLARNEQAVARIRHGVVLTCLGGPGPITYKKSRRGDSEIDRAFVHLLQSSSAPHQIVDFSPYGYDERQYCSPGFNLPVGCLSRSEQGAFPEYHTSADNPDLVQPAALTDSLERCVAAVELLEKNKIYRNLCPKGEPQLGRRGLYEGLGAGDEGRRRAMALLWVLNLSDGEHSLLEIAERAHVPFATIAEAADALAATDLLERL